MSRASRFLIGLVTGFATHDGIPAVARGVWPPSCPVPRADGAPYLVPLSVDWDGEALLMATPTDSPTGRNLAATQAVRLGRGQTRVVSMIEGESKSSRSTRCRRSGVPGSSCTPASTRVRWPRRAAGSGSSPRRIQAWREVNEMPDRELAA